MHQQWISAVLPSVALTLFCSFAFFSVACSRGSVLERTGESKTATSETKPIKDYEVQMLGFPSFDSLRPTKLSELVGKEKVIVLDFWATWCGPCRQEIPHLTALQREYKDRGVEVIGLSIEDPRADAQKVKDFAKEFAINYQLGFSTHEMFAAFNNDPRMPIPQTFIFGRDGNLVEHIKGMDPRFMRERLQEAIEKALKTTGKAS